MIGRRPALAFAVGFFVPATFVAALLTCARDAEPLEARLPRRHTTQTLRLPRPGEALDLKDNAIICTNEDLVAIARYIYPLLKSDLATASQFPAQCRVIDTSFDGVGCQLTRCIASPYRFSLDGGTTWREGSLRGAAYTTHAFVGGQPMDGAGFVAAEDVNPTIDWRPKTNRSRRHTDGPMSFAVAAVTASDMIAAVSTSYSCTVNPRAKIICGDGPGRAVALQRLTEEYQRGASIPGLGDAGLQHLALLIDRAPEVVSRR